MTVKPSYSIIKTFIKQKREQLITDLGNDGYDRITKCESYKDNKLQFGMLSCDDGIITFKYDDEFVYADGLAFIGSMPDEDSVGFGFSAAFELAYRENWVTGYSK